jgi:hypothetical protein
LDSQLCAGSVVEVAAHAAALVAAGFSSDLDLRKNYRKNKSPRFRTPYSSPITTRNSASQPEPQLRTSPQNAAN